MQNWGVNYDRDKNTWQNRSIKKCIKENGLDCDTAIDEIRERIEEFEKIVTERFYIQEEKCEPVKHKMKDGNLAYKILKPSDIRIDNYTIIKPYYLSGGNFFESAEIKLHIWKVIYQMKSLLNYAKIYLLFFQK